MFALVVRALSCFCVFQSGLHAEKCTSALLSQRKSFAVPAGRSVSLSCEVQHCGEVFKAHWFRANRTESPVKESFREGVKESFRHRSAQVKLTDDKIQLELKIARVVQQDEGFYSCFVTWGDQSSEVGHATYVNVTEGGPEQRKVLHRVLVCAGAILCLPVLLALACWLSSEVKPQLLPRGEVTYATVHKVKSRPEPPQPPPRCPVPKTRTQKAPPKSSHKVELVYADVSQDPLQEQGIAKEALRPTIYSSVKFS